MTTKDIIKKYADDIIERIMDCAHPVCYGGVNDWGLELDEDPGIEDYLHELIRELKKYEDSH